jgi:hypothetical protein
MYEGRSVKAVMNVTNGPEEISDQARMERQKVGLPVVELSTRDSAAFVEALLDPMPVNSRLRKAICRYRELTGDMRSLSKSARKNVPCRMGGDLYAKAYIRVLYASEYT